MSWAAEYELALTSPGIAELVPPRTRGMRDGPAETEVRYRRAGAGWQREGMRVFSWKRAILG